MKKLVFLILPFLFFVSQLSAQKKAKGTIFESPSAVSSVEYNYQFCSDWAQDVRKLTFNYEINTTPLFDGIAISWNLGVELGDNYYAYTDKGSIGFHSKPNFSPKSKKVNLPTFFNFDKIQEIKNRVSVDVEFPLSIYLNTSKGKIEVLSKVMKAHTVSQGKPYKNFIFISYSDLKEEVKEAISKEVWVEEIEFQSKLSTPIVISVDVFHDYTKPTKITLVGGCLETEMRMLTEYQRLVKNIDFNFLKMVWSHGLNYDELRDLNAAEKKKLKDEKLNLEKINSFDEKYREINFSQASNSGIKSDVSFGNKILKEIEEDYGEINVTEETADFKEGLNTLKNKVWNNNKIIKAAIEKNQLNNEKSLIQNTVTINKALNQSENLNLALILDLSGSMGGEKLSYMKTASAYLLNLYTKNKFSITVYSFGTCSNVKNLITPMTKDLSLLQSNLSNLSADGNSPSFETVSHVLKSLNKQNSKNVVIVMTDGDWGGSCMSLERLKTEIHLHPKIKIHSVGIQLDTYGSGVEGLRSIAVAANGNYYDGNNLNQLKKAFYNSIFEYLFDLKNSLPIKPFSLNKKSYTEGSWGNAINSFLLNEKQREKLSTSEWDGAPKKEEKPSEKTDNDGWDEPIKTKKKPNTKKENDGWD